MMIAGLLWAVYPAAGIGAVVAGDTYEQPERGTDVAPHRQRDFFPPWEGAGVYYFGGLLLDLNRRIERWVPGYPSRLTDCSTDELFCLTARQEGARGVVAFAGPRWCSDFRVGDGWSSGNVRTSVLARVERDSQPSREFHLDHHRYRPRLFFLLGHDSNPEVVYEYHLERGVVRIYLGLSRYADLVGDVRRGLNPETLPREHRHDIGTLDRFAPCRWRRSAADPSRRNE